MASQNRTILKFLAIASIGLALTLIGCREYDQNRDDHKFSSDAVVTAQQILKTYGPYIADVEFRDNYRASRAAAVAVSSGGGNVLLLGNLSRLSSASPGDYRVYWASRENLDATLVGSYLAGLDAAILKLPQASPVSLPVDIARSESLRPGANVVLLYLDHNGPVRACEATINNISAGGPEHCPRLLVETQPGVSFDTAIVFACEGGGLAGIVSPDSFRNDGLTEVFEATALLQKQYWQFTGDRYGLSQMLDRVDLPAK